MAFYPKGVAYTRTFKMIATSDHIAAAANATPIVMIAKAGGWFLSPGGSTSQIANGWYKIALTATDTNTAGDLSFLITSSFGADPTDFVDQVFDLATAAFGVNVQQWNLTQVATPATAGIPDINVKNYANQTATTDANNLPNVNVQDWKGNVVTFSTVSGTPNVNVTQWAGQTASYDSLSNLPAVSTGAVVNGVWNEATSLHQTAGTTGKALTSAASAGDPWTTALPGTYTAGQAGFIVGTNLDTTISSRMASYTQPTGFLSATFPSGTIANTTNITSATGITLGSVQPVNTIQWNGQTATYDATNKLPNVNTQDWNGSVVTSLPTGFLTTTFPSSVASPTNITAATGVTLAAVPPVNVIQWLATQPLALSSQQVQAVVPASTVVASISGAVGSVTGNVGGNVVGSVGTVTGSVGSISGVTFPTNFSAIAIDASGNVKIQANVKKNQALTRFEFLITDSTNHAPATGAAATSPTRSIDGGAFGAGTLSAVTEVGNGIYYVDFGAGDLNGNVITLKVTSTNNDTVYATLVTSP